jgi:L-alanine-DL-glutamate epimerase-like enolase superfamily enzyme
MKIEKIVGHLLDEETKTFTWQVGRPGSGDGRAPNRSYTCFLRLITDEGVEGHSLMPQGRIIMDLIERRVAGELLGKDPLQIEFIWERLWDLDRIEMFPLYLIASVDLALWDLKGKVCGLPVYQLFGGYRDRIPAYASTTSYDTEEEYLRVIDAALEEGYTSIKLHLRYRDVETNARLCRTVRKHVGDDIDLTLDASALWNFTDSLRFGRVLEELGFSWYEEPMREFDLESYAKLCSDLDIPVLAAECSYGAHWNAGEFARRGACDILRTSTQFKGGFTGGMKVAHVAESFGMRAEVHGNGMANLQLGLAVPNNTFYEDLVIDEDDIRNKKHGYIPFENGTVRIPDGVTGLGLEMDASYAEKHAVKTITFPE